MDEMGRKKAEQESGQEAEQRPYHYTSQRRETKTFL